MASSWGGGHCSAGDIRLAIPYIWRYSTLSASLASMLGRSGGNMCWCVLHTVRGFVR